MRLVVVTPPALEPITLEEAKLHLRVEIDDDDLLIASLISAARIMCESALSQTLIATTVDMFLDGWPCDPRRGYPSRELKVYSPPLLSVTSVGYYDTAGTLQAMDPADYIASTGIPGRISLAPWVCWPSLQCSRPDAVIVRMVLGYGETAASVPENIKAAMKLLIGNLYENREAVVVGTITAELPFAVKALLSASDHGHYA